MLAGLGGGVVGAGATMWATSRTLKQQAREARDERARAAVDAFEAAARRADKQMLTSRTLLGLAERPSAPFITLDHDAIDTLLTFRELPTEVAFELERASAAMRYYNASALWGNSKLPMSGAEGPATERWSETQDLVTIAFEAYKTWRGSALPALHPLVE